MLSSFEFIIRATAYPLRT